MSSTSRAWIVAASVGLVEALKDQGFCRWNYTIRSIHHHAKASLRSFPQANSKLSSPSSAAVSTSLREQKQAKQSEESLRKVLNKGIVGGDAIVNNDVMKSDLNVATILVNEVGNVEKDPGPQSNEVEIVEETLEIQRDEGNIDKELALQLVTFNDPLLTKPREQFNLALGSAKVAFNSLDAATSVAIPQLPNTNLEISSTHNYSSNDSISRGSTPSNQNPKFPFVHWHHQCEEWKMTRI
ncbi:hypothetical protein Vadar_027367 [Vaccinium darrowii]|uniref:Uncharacterized protein n=1 Tax=Vaccinium darrowii TaxID=229202 RepID=A0ACB7Z6U2_9ERIC|nr:hypothetical protein Vadar_027367 [Vaccinium darrowii]